MPNIPWESLESLKHLHQRVIGFTADVIIRMKILNDSLKEEREMLEKIIEETEDE